MRVGDWSDEEVAILRADNQAGVPRSVTAIKLDRLKVSVEDKARNMRLLLPLAQAEVDAVRARWAEKLPQLRENLRRELNA